MNEPYLRLHQARLTQRAIGSSTARGQGTRGAVARSRAWLSELDPGRLSSPGAAGFPEALDCATEDLHRRLPDGARNWGAACKFLKIFLPDALYNRYTCKRYGLARLESAFEAPLDVHVGTGLRCEPEGARVPH